MLKLNNEIIAELETLAGQSRVKMADLRRVTENMKTVAAEQASQQKSQRFAWWVTVLMGVGIPALSLVCSSFVGELWHTLPVLAGAFALVGLAVMGVSITHLTWAIGDITRSPWGPSLVLAIAIDACIVLCELANVMGHNGAMVLGTMVTATLVSMVLNVYAFLYHTK